MSEESDTSRRPTQAAGGQNDHGGFGEHLHGAEHHGHHGHEPDDGHAHLGEHNQTSQRKQSQAHTLSPQLAVSELCPAELSQKRFDFGLRHTPRIHETTTQQV